MKQTYQTKLFNLKSKKKPVVFSQKDIAVMKNNSILNSYLNEFASYFQTIERKLFVDMVYRDTSIIKLKASYQKVYGINARQFNSIKAQIEGKIKAIKELKKAELESKTLKLKQLNVKLNKTVEDKKSYFEKLSSSKNTDQKFSSIVKQYRKAKAIIHYTKRKIQSLIFKINKIKSDLKNNIVRICFGSKDLFRKQYNLIENGYKNHEEWKKDWLQNRSNQFMCLGSKDESFGNQICQYDNSNNLKIKVASKFETIYGENLIFNDVKFKYGQTNIDKCKESYVGYTKSYNEQKYYKAMAHRFYRTKFGWYLLTTVEINEPTKITDTKIGAIGIDFNVNFAQLAFVDRFGNPLDELKIKYSMYGKTTNQINALMCNLARDICDIAKCYKTSIFIENLTLEDTKVNVDKGKKYNRMISSFPYKKFRETVSARAFKTGVKIETVNPRYTSIIGQFKFMKKYGFSSHGAAACIIARRGLKLKTESINTANKEFLKTNKRNININKDNYKIWMQLNELVKNKLSFNERLEKLYTNTI